MNKTEVLPKLNTLFGSYRAEWLREKIFEFFEEPSYFSALKDFRPFVLEGGRGTGKTTVLKGLSYQGQYSLHDSNIVEFDKIDFIGIYHRVNTNHVRAFIGGGLDLEDWRKIFSHYFNLVVVREIASFLVWYRKQNSSLENLSLQSLNLICKSLCISENCLNEDELLTRIEGLLIDFQSSINSVPSISFTHLTMADQPIRVITEQVLKLSQFEGKIFYLILDEYENFEDYQQQVVNTFIKHSSEYFTFKVGVRELGWRVKHTLNRDELLHDPADYVLFSIENQMQESLFSRFAKSVCEQRINQLVESGQQLSIESMFASITPEDEAVLLGVEQTQFYETVNTLICDSYDELKTLPSLYKYFIGYWVSQQKDDLNIALKDIKSLRTKWDERYENYKYHVLFNIKKGRGKGGIQKYYAGWSTFVKLSRGNIRYLMELVYRSLEKHIEQGASFGESVSVSTQTLAAQDVGKKNLSELEGLWKNGASITKLILGFGRIFQVLSSSEGRFSPEKNQFSIENSEGIGPECQELLNAAVMNLAFVRSPGNKLTATSHTRDYIYSIHPIYAPFFVFSYRKKRKFFVKQENILGLVSKPKDTITEILKSCNIENELSTSLPQQLDIFEHFYK